MKRNLTILGDKGYPVYIVHFTPLCPDKAYRSLQSAVEWRTCFKVHKKIDQLTLVGNGYEVFNLNWEWISKLERWT